MADRFENGFGGLVAVVTGGGTGMGRELVRQLTAQGCDVATCDVIAENLAETVAICAADGNSGKILSHIADVSNEAQVLGFRDAVAAWRPHVNVLFNNAGIGGGGSIVENTREQWDKTFGVCWFGVYYNTRAFMDLLLAAPFGHIVNTSSVNGFWASLGPNTPHSAYSAAKFAVKGFTEALITDFRMNAPTMRASVVMPGHIGTDIASIPDADLRKLMSAGAEAFRDMAPMTAAEASAFILASVQRGDWRILVGDDAVILDEMVRENPKDAYLPDFHQQVQARGALGAIAR